MRQRQSPFRDLVEHDSPSRCLRLSWFDAGLEIGRVPGLVEVEKKVELPSPCHLGSRPRISLRFAARLPHFGCGSSSRKARLPLLSVPHHHQLSLYPSLHSHSRSASPRTLVLTRQHGGVQVLPAEPLRVRQQLQVRASAERRRRAIRIRSERLCAAVGVWGQRKHSSASICIRRRW